MEGQKIPFPDWEVVRMLGRGSFGEVYEIQRNNFGSIERAALKVITIPQSKNDIEELYNDGYDSESITARFQSYLESIVKEYSLMTEMKGHGNIVYCDDLKHIQHDDGIGWDIYIKMELLTPLVKSLTQSVTDDQVSRLGIDICNALMLCRSKNIVHRDIKPQNIFVSQDGSYKLGDFGVAKTAERTTSGTKVGTYKYMAPEVYKSEPYGAGADIYSLGLVMYWMLNERRTPFLPLPPQTPTATMEDDARLRRFKGERLPAPAHGSEELKRIILKACAYNPKERYHSAAEMREELLRINDRAEGTVGVFFDWEEKERQRRMQEEKARREQEQREKERAEERRRQEEERKRKEEEEKQEAAREAERIRKQREEEEKRKKNLIIAMGACVCVLAVIVVLLISNSQKNSTLAALGYSDALHIQNVDTYFWGQSKYPRSAVKAVYFQNTLDDVPSTAWDVSEVGDKSIMAWLNGDTLVVAANGTIRLNPNSAALFYGFSNLKEIEFGNCVDTSEVQSMRYMFARSGLVELDLSSFNTSHVNDMACMFWECVQLNKLELSGFDTSRVTDMTSMFNSCSSLTHLDVSDFNTSKVTTMGRMFDNCYGLKALDLSNFNTSSVENMGSMFEDCSALISLNLSGFDTHKVDFMGNMFYGCSGLIELDLSGFNTQNVTYMGTMFYNCLNLTKLDLSGFKTDNVTHMGSMFEGCSNLRQLDLSGFETSNVDAMWGIFAHCTNLESVISSDKKIMDAFTSIKEQY